MNTDGGRLRHLFLGPRTEALPSSVKLITRMNTNWFASQIFFGPRMNTDEHGLGAASPPFFGSTNYANEHELIADAIFF